MEPDYLAQLLREFYGSAAPKLTESRKKSLSEAHAQEYHKNTMKNIRGAINRHLKTYIGALTLLRTNNLKNLTIC